MVENIIEEIRKFVEEECRKPTNSYGYELHKNHIVLVENYAKKLAKKTGVDEEVIILAALLHDVGSAVSGREDHQITGVNIAEEKLKEFNYPKEKIEIIKKCILNHRGSINNYRESKEEQIIVDADSMVAFDSLSDLFGAAYICETKNKDEAKISVRNKLINKWNQLSPDAKEIVKPKYDAAMFLLK